MQEPKAERQLAGVPSIAGTPTKSGTIPTRSVR